MKKTQYKYFVGIDPPGPFVHVALSVPGESPQLTAHAAHLDTGAYKTVIPQGSVDQLGLLRVRECQVEGLDGVVVVLPTYLVEIAIKDLSPVVAEVLASPGEQYVLLGRDMLNRFKITLDGPNLELFIEEP
jgi:predicted aspartyl protease